MFDIYLFAILYSKLTHPYPSLKHKRRKWVQNFPSLLYQGRIKGWVSELKPQTIARQIARDFRKNQTVSENIFWQKVRNRKFLGLKFTRQHPVFYKYNCSLRFFIADFFCAEIKLIIEIDGGIHLTQMEYDKKREEILANKNYKILRYKNSEIENNINKVLIHLKHQIDAVDLTNSSLPFS